MDFQQMFSYLKQGMKGRPKNSHRDFYFRLDGCDMIVDQNGDHMLPSAQYFERKDWEIVEDDAYHVKNISRWLNDIESRYGNLTSLDQRISIVWLRNKLWEELKK